MKITPPIPAGPVVHIQHVRYCVWRQRVEQFKATCGAREVLGHLPESSWAQRFAANEDAYSAVAEELEKVCD